MYVARSPTITKTYKVIRYFCALTSKNDVASRWKLEATLNFPAFFSLPQLHLLLSSPCDKNFLQLQDKPQKKSWLSKGLALQKKPQSGKSEIIIVRKGSNELIRLDLAKPAYNDQLLLCSFFSCYHRTSVSYYRHLRMFISNYYSTLLEVFQIIFAPL